MPVAKPLDLPFDPIERAAEIWGDRFGPADAMAAVTSIMRAQQILLAGLDGLLRPYGLTFARYEALVLLAFSRRGALPLRVIGERLMVHPTSVTNTVDRLERDGLVRRRPNPRDGRGILAEITPGGRDVVTRSTADLMAARFGMARLRRAGTRGDVHPAARAAGGRRGLPPGARRGGRQRTGDGCQCRRRRR